MNEVLLKRLIGACALVGVTVALANLLPEPSALPPPEPAAKRVAFDLRPAPPKPLGAATEESAPTSVEEPSKPNEIASAAPPLAKSEAPVKPVEAEPTTKPAPAPQHKAAPKPPVKVVKPAVQQASKPAPKPLPKETSSAPTESPTHAKEMPPPPKESPAPEAPRQPETVAEAAPIAEPPEPKATQAWFVQIGAFAKESNAEQSFAKLKKAGLKAQQDRLEWKTGTRYRVRCGPFGSKEEAEAERARAAGLGFGDNSLAHEPG